MSSTTSPLLRRVAGLAAAAVSVLALGACGSSSSGSSGSSSTTADADAGRVKLAQCLRENGVDIPDPGGAQGGAPPQDIDRTKVQKALDGPCKAYQQGAFGNVSAEDRQERQDAFQAFSQCMRDKGIDVPALGTGGGGPPQGANRIDQDDPKTQAALKACQGKLPRGIGGPGGPGQ